MLAAPAISIAGAVSGLVFVPPVVCLSRSVLPLCPVVPGPAFEDGRDITQLSPPYIRGAGVELAPLLLAGFRQVVESGLRFCGFFGQEGGIVVCRLFDDAPQEARVRLGFV